MSSLSRDSVWMVVLEGGTPYTPAPSIHLAKTPSSFRNPLNVLNAMAIFPLSRWSSNCSSRASINCACRCLLVSAVCHWVYRVKTVGGERKRERGIYHRLQSHLQLQLLFDNMCGFISFTCKQWIRGLFDYCAPRFHFLSARWLSASYHSRFRHSSVDTKKVTTHWHEYQAKDDDEYMQHTEGLTSGLSHSKCEWDVRR